jgi:tRNA(Ile)-lysidine synthase
MKLENLNKAKKYLLAVSGGIDSMVMADLFLQQQLEFSVAHCNFQLREEDSNLDEQLVIDWCIKNNIDYFIKRVDTKEYCAQHKCSIQVGAREIRYAFFDEICADKNIDFIVTAHHQDDTIETTLFQFFRGTGIKGLTGIPARNQKIIRPLLSYSKQQIVDYAAKFQVAFREDKSNLKQDYSRNKMRLHIIPQLEELYPAFKNNIANNIHRMNEVNEIYLQQIKNYKKKLIEQRGKDFYIPILKLKTISPLATILFELIKEFHFSYEQTLQVLQLLERQTGSFVASQTHQIIKNRNFLIVTEKNTQLSELILMDEGNTKIETQDFVMKLKSIRADKFEINKGLKYCAIDAKLIEFPLLLRKWRTGDYLYPFGMTKKKKLSKVLIDAKIPLHEKETIWVVESNKKIVWVVGVKSDNRFRVSEKTQNVLCFEIK